jgi:putative ABC transport system substrate-binding protein
VTPVIGYLNGTTENSSRATTTSFHQGVGELGYVEGRNVEILYRWAEYQYDRLPALAAELVRRRIAVIVATVARHSSGCKVGDSNDSDRICNRYGPGRFWRRCKPQPSGR